LDEIEYQHLVDLARNAGHDPARKRRRRSPGRSVPRAAVQTILDGLVGVPAYVRTSRLDIIAANELCQALYDGALDVDRLPVNLARYLFLDPASRGFFLDWDAVADDFVGSLRLNVGRDPRNRELSDLVGELSTRSDEFVTRWARQSVRAHHSARKRLHNRVVGDIELTGNSLELPGDDLVIIAYTADVGSAAEDQLRLLATWSATRSLQPTTEEKHHA
jgi:hypothetical protein